jgi:hypothetical protein
VPSDPISVHVSSIGDRAAPWALYTLDATHSVTSHHGVLAGLFCVDTHLGSNNVPKHNINKDYKLLVLFEKEVMILPQSQLKLI